MNTSSRPLNISSSVAALRSARPENPGRWCKAAAPGRWDARQGHEPASWIALGATLAGFAVCGILLAFAGELALVA